MMLNLVLGLGICQFLIPIIDGSQKNELSWMGSVCYGVNENILSLTKINFDQIK